MCKESIQLEIIKKSEITKKKKRPPALSFFFIEIRTRNNSFLFTWPKPLNKGFISTLL